MCATKIHFKNVSNNLLNLFGLCLEKIGSVLLNCLNSVLSMLRV